MKNIYSLLPLISPLCLSTLYAGQAPATSTGNTTERPDVFMEQSLGVMSSINNHTSVDTLWGFTTGRGYTFAEGEAVDHRVFFKTGWFYGTQSERTGDLSSRYRQEMLPFTVGYRYTYTISPGLSVYAGVNAGYVYSSSQVKMKDDYGMLDGKLSTSSNSFLLGVGVGATCQISTDWSLTAGYGIDEMFNMKRFTADNVYPKKSSAALGTFHIGLTRSFGYSAMEMAPTEKDNWYIYGSIGMMHTDRGVTYDGDQWFASELYGAGVSIEREMNREENLESRLGFKTGYYSGGSSNRISMFGSLAGYELKSKTNVVPLLATWNWVYHVRPNFALRAGVTGGALVYHTNFRMDSWVEDEHSSATGKTSSTRFLPTIGAQIAAEVNMSETSTMFISYDFFQTFGRDNGHISTNTEEYQSACRSIPQEDRFFGLISAGVSYKF